ncbi:MAG: hypothetical protein CMD07_02090 [Flavobacteriales bacterium]|nr:hypothetical protein [Flavobacteriales bacterium]
MKKIFFVLFLVFSILVKSQSIEINSPLPYPMLDYYPFNSQTLPSPIQFSKYNILTPQINLDCSLKARSITYYNSYYTFGQIVPEYSIVQVYGSWSQIPDSISNNIPDSLTSGPPNFVPLTPYINSGFDSASVTGFINIVSTEFLTGWSQWFYFDNNGNILLYNQISYPLSSSSYIYNESGLPIYNNNLSYGNSANNSLELQWTNENQICTVIDSGEINSTYEFNSNNILAKYQNFNYENSNLDSINFHYNDDKLIIQSQISYINSSQIICDYNWIDESNLEITFNNFQNGDSVSNLIDGNISKIIYEVDSNLYVTKLTYLDSNFNKIISCEYLFCEDEVPIYGCIDSLACNFDSLANTNNGFCAYIDECGDCGGPGPEIGYDCAGNCLDGTSLVTIDVGGGNWASEIEWEIQNFEGSAGVFELCLEDGCSLFNISTSFGGEGWYGNQITITENLSQSTILSGNLVGNNSGGIAIGINSLEECEGGIGCSDLSACNYDEEALVSDMLSCIYPQEYFDCDGNCINDYDLDGECDEFDYNDDLGKIEPKNISNNLIKIIDVIGREYKSHKDGIILFYIYEHGKVAKKYTKL